MNKPQKPWYKHWWGVILAFLIWPFFLLWFVWAKSKQHILIKVGASIFLVFCCAAYLGAFLQTLSGSSYSTPQASSPSSSASVASSPSQSISTSPSPTPTYEILSENTENGFARIEVYTTKTTDSDLVAMNDEILNKYKSGRSNLYIDYFNNKEAAKDYFKRQLDDSVSEEEKNQLYTHYIANMVYNTNSGLKQLVRQGSTQVVIKKY